MTSQTPSVVVVGRPYAAIGMGEHARSTIRALRAGGLRVCVVDPYEQDDPDPETRAEFSGMIVPKIRDGIAIFCINGNEIKNVLDKFNNISDELFKIVYPAWELPEYPAEWARQIERFDEVWSASRYTYEGIARAVARPACHLPLATEPRPPRPMGRRAFGIPETSYVFLLFADLTSYLERKNPLAALEAFRRARDHRPDADARFIVKLNSSSARPAERRDFLAQLQGFGDSVIVIDRTLRDAEVKALHLAADAFVSLHRAEGYGFGPAEAMFFGRPVIATGYSGNMDFMTPETSFPISYRLVPVAEGAYPHGAGQVWADADVDEAAAVMVRLLDDPSLGRTVGARASRHMRTHFSYRAIGLRMAERLASIA